MLAPERTDAEALAGVQPAPRGRGIPAEVWIVAAITVAGAALRFSTLSAQSYWSDEATTAHEVLLPLGALLHQIHVNETTPPLYFILAWLWAKVLGNGEAGLRSLSALLGTGLVPITYLCGRELVSKRAGLLAGAFAALSPFMIWYSQEARAYMLFAVLCGLSFLFFARALRTRSDRDIAWWGVWSALAILTHFFAAFLVAPEGLWLLYAVRRRSVLIADVGVAVVQVAVLPLAIGDTTHPLNWIQGFPLFTRIQQIPTDFAVRSLSQGSGFTYGLWGAGVLAAIVAVLLNSGATPAERRGAGVAAAIAGCVILVPIALAALGADYVVPRNFIPAWIPLAVVVGAACTAWRTLPAGAALCVAVLGVFVWAQARIDQDAAYQRPNWRGVAAALGRPSGTRAIVPVDDGSFATGPMSLYLNRSVLRRYGGPVSIDELDAVGKTYQAVPSHLPPGTRLIGTRTVDGYLVARFALTPPESLTPPALASHAASLIGAGSAYDWVLVQPPGA
jgi:4-amino-4-deoxy-L-arabinose transferase-like glycosyltransferase